MLGEEEGSSLEKELIEAIPSGQPTITPGDRSIAPTALFGIWSDAPKNIGDIRQKPGNATKQ